MVDLQEIRERRTHLVRMQAPLSPPGYVGINAEERDQLCDLAAWAEKAREALQFIGCKKDRYRGCQTDCGPYVGLCDRCELLKSYPGGQQ